MSVHHYSRSLLLSPYSVEVLVDCILKSRVKPSHLDLDGFAADAAEDNITAYHTAVRSRTDHVVHSIDI